MAMMVHIRCEDCGCEWYGDPEEELCPECGGDNLDWEEPEPGDVY